MPSNSLAAGDAFDPKLLSRLFNPVMFSNGSGCFSSSHDFDTALIKALNDDRSHLERRLRSNERARAQCKRSGGGVTWLDAWAFLRGDSVAVSHPPILGRMADFGLLEHAREARTGRTLAHALVDWHRGDASEMWRILCRGGVDLNLADANDITPLSQAAENANQGLMCILFELGADPAAIGWDQGDATALIADVAEHAANRLSATGTDPSSAGD